MNTRGECTRHKAVLLFPEHCLARYDVPLLVFHVNRTNQPPKSPHNGNATLTHVVRRVMVPI